MRPRSSACVGCLVATAVSLLAAPAVAAPRLDPRFGDGGVARALFEDSRQDLWGPLRPVRQVDGKVLVAAQPDPDHGQTFEVMLARFTRAGALDKTFGQRGRLRMSFAVPQQFRPLTVSAQRDGRIVLVGTVGGYAYFSGTPSQLGIIRLLPDGSPDRSFGTNGFVVWNPPWRTADEWTVPGSVLRQPNGGLLVTATIYDPRLRGAPAASPPRAVLVRFQPNGSVDESFGQGGFAELDRESEFGRWAQLADGRLASVVPRNEGTGLPTRETTSWWLDTFSPDGVSAAPLRPTSSVRLGLNLIDELVDLAPTRDGGLLMMGDVDVQHERGPATAVHRIRPDGSLDATFGRKCAQPPLRARTRGGAATRDGAAFVTATKFLIHARPRRADSLAIAYGATGCLAGTPLRVRGLVAGPPLLQRGRSALVGATFQNPEGVGGLALIKIRR